MTQIPTRRAAEGFNIGRILMVLSSVSPLFVLWGLKGTSIVPDRYLIPFCAAMVILPNVFLFWRIRRATIKRDRREIVVGAAQDYRYHLLTYIFAMLLPFYRQDIATTRELLAVCVALLFIIALFWKLNLHYINFIFIVRGYHAFLVHPCNDDNPYSSSDSFVVITHRTALNSGQSIIAYHVSETVFLELGPI